MKVTVSYQSLMNVLGFPNTILSDKSVDDKSKNIIFLVRPDGMKVVGYNVFTFSRTEMDIVESEDIPESGWEFQVKASNLNKVLSSFSSLYKTKVDNVSFSEEGVKIKLSVYEEAIKEEDSRLAQVSEFYLENVPIIANVNTEIHMGFPESVDLLTSGDLSLYIDSLMPLMSNDSAGSNASKLNFAPDYVFVMCGYMSAFFKNRLPEAFKGMALSYSSINFLKKLLEGVDSINVCRIDKYLCVQSGTTEAFLKHQNIKLKHEPYLKKMDKTLGVSVDRFYLKDVLRRMGNVATDGKMFIMDDGNLNVVCTDFQQNIPMNKVKPGTSGIGFNITIKYFENGIIGKEDVFSSDVFIYFVKMARGYMVFMQDKSGAWISSTQVTEAKEEV